MPPIFINPSFYDPDEEFTCTTSANQEAQQWLNIQKDHMEDSLRYSLSKPFLVDSSATNNPFPIEVKAESPTLIEILVISTVVGIVLSIFHQGIRAAYTKYKEGNTPKVECQYILNGNCVK